MRGTGAAEATGSGVGERPPRRAAPYRVAVAQPTNELAQPAAAGPEAAAACWVCGDETRPRPRAGLPFRECATCGFGMLEGVEERDDYWRAHGGDPSDASHDASPAEDPLGYWSVARASYFDGALDLLEASLPPSRRRLLDVGGGAGFFAERALRRGWDAYSLDVSPTARDLAARRLGGERAWLALEGGRVGTFDAVTLWCVIAHTATPRSVLGEAAAALAPGGVLWATTPNFDFQRLLYARLKPLLVRRPFDFGAPDHIGHFTPAALYRLVAAAGLNDPRLHFRGVTEACLFTGYSRSRALVRAKSAWNRAAMAAARRGLPNLMSELQVTARKPSGHA
jgi:SAM-dependent methyltransferase